MDTSKNVTTVIFDIGGTLVDSLKGEQFFALFDGVAAELGVDGELFMNWWMRDRERLYKRSAGLVSMEDELTDASMELFGSVDEARILAARKAQGESVRNWLIPRHDAISTIERLKRAGYKIGIISNCTCEVPEAWPALPIAKLVDVAVFSCDVGMCKPDPGIYYLACEKLGVQPEECIYVGDGCDNELTAAEKLGMRSVLICVPYEKDIVMSHEDPQNWQGSVVEKLSDICELCGC